MAPQFNVIVAVEYTDLGDPNIEQLAALENNDGSITIVGTTAMRSAYESRIYKLSFGLSYSF